MLSLAGAKLQRTVSEVRLPAAGRTLPEVMQEVASARPAPEPVAISATLRRTGLVQAYLERAGLNPEQAGRWSSVFTRFTGRRVFEGGEALTVYKDPDSGELRGLRYNLDPRFAVIELDLGNGVIKVLRRRIRYRLEPVAVAFKMGGNWQSAAARNGVPPKIAQVIGAALEDQRALRRGSIVKILFTEKVSLDGTCRRPGSLEAAEVRNHGSAVVAIALRDRSGAVHLYDQNGAALGLRAMRFPVRFKYISSGFSYHRYHPLLHIYRPHLGVDFATNYGTPVQAVADGRVVAAGWCGELGRCVRIAHSNDTVTIYGHLARIKPGVREGVRVSMGQVVGQVGSSGLSTGPHLHFAIEKHDRFVNPLTQKLGENHPVSLRMHAMFERLKARYLAMLDRMPKPSDRFAMGGAGSGATVANLPARRASSARASRWHSAHGWRSHRARHAVRRTTLSNIRSAPAYRFSSGL